MLVIRRTLAHGNHIGLTSGLGAATADAFYGFIAAFGLTALSNLLIDNATWLGLFGGLFLLYLGIKTFRTPPATEAAHIKQPSSGYLGAYGSTLFLTLTNPMTIIAFVGIFAGLGVAESDTSGAFWMVIGVFIGSALWWLTLSTMVGILRGRFSPQWMLWVNRLSGTIIILFALRILLL